MRLLVRDGTSASLAGELGAELVSGDLRDPPSVDRAVRGMATVITTVTAMARALAGERLDLRAVDGRGILTLVEAAERAGVQRFVYVSYAGLSDQAARCVPIAAAKRAVERRLLASPMQHTIVRPDGFQELWLSPITQFDWARGRVIVFGRGDARARYVAMDDVAEAIVHWALADDAPAMVEFGGPEPLTRTRPSRYSRPPASEASARHTYRVRRCAPACACCGARDRNSRRSWDSHSSPISRTQAGPTSRCVSSGSNLAASPHTPCRRCTINRRTEPQTRERVPTSQVRTTATAGRSGHGSPGGWDHSSSSRAGVTRGLAETLARGAKEKSWSRS